MIIYLLPIIIALGIVASYDDIKNGMIRNKYIISAFALSAIIHLIFLLDGTIDLTYIAYLLLNIIFAIGLGFWIWYIGAWNAGDAKLYAAFVSLMPLDSYARASTQIPTGDYLINTFLIAAVYLLVKTIFETDKEQKIAAVKQSFNLKKIGQSILAIYAVGWLTKYVFLYTNIKKEYLLNILIIIIILWSLKKVLNEDINYFLAFLVIMRLVVNRGELMNPASIITFVTTLAGYIIIMQIMTELTNFNKKKVNIYKLKPNMVLLESFDKKGFGMKLTEKNLKKAVLMPYRGFLTKKTIDEIHKKHKKGMLHFNTLEVIERSPFAHYLFMAALMTIIAQGSTYLFIKSIL